MLDPLTQKPILGACVSYRLENICWSARRYWNEFYSKCARYKEKRNNGYAAHTIPYVIAVAQEIVNL